MVILALIVSEENMGKSNMSPLGKMQTIDKFETRTKERGIGEQRASQVDYLRGPLLHTPDQADD